MPEFDLDVWTLGRTRPKPVNMDYLFGACPRQLEPVPGEDFSNLMIGKFTFITLTTPDGESKFRFSPILLKAPWKWAYHAPTKTFWFRLYNHGRTITLQIDPATEDVMRQFGGLYAYHEPSDN